MIKYVDELFNDKCYQNMLVGIFSPKNKRVFMPEEIKAFEAF